MPTRPTSADDAPLRLPGWRGRSALAACLLLAIVPSATPGSGEAAAPAKVPPEQTLLEAEPFDLITLDGANKNAQLKVLPLLDGTRKAPFVLDLKATYRIRLVERSDREYEVQGRNIVKVELYEELLLKEANRLVAEGRFDEAFSYFYLLRTRYPELPGLDKAINDYLYLDAVQLTRSGRYREAIGLVEELLGRQRDYRHTPDAPSLLEFLGGLVDRLVGAYVQQRNFPAARTVLARIRGQYRGDTPECVGRWVARLQEMAAGKREEARRQMEAQRYHEAIAAAREMVAIWPEIEGGEELRRELARRYPLVTVGVMQPACEHDALRLDNWSARRTGRLVHRHLVEFLGAGPEGGQYEFPLGTIERSDDRLRLTLRLRPVADRAPAVSGYEIARCLLERADPSAARYSPAWAALAASVTVRDPLQVDVELRRAHVLPESLLRFPLQTGGAAGGGPFAVAGRTPREVRFVMKSFQPGGNLAELVEHAFADGQQAWSALRRGDIDIIDRIFPADAMRLRDEAASQREVRIERYALPTLHMLVPNTRKNPYLAHRDFRRALVCAVDRQKLLEQELLGGRDVPGCRVVSGPFPAGAGDRDPLSYAYDASIAPLPYRPHAARLLALVAQKQVAERAKARGESAPPLAPLVIGHPAQEAARVACQAIAAYWKNIGVESAVQEFPPGISQPASDDCDLVYLEVAIWEPVVDAFRLLGPGGPAASDSPYVRQALWSLEQSQSWSEVRERLLEIHGVVHNDVAVIPLWQLVDFFAYHTRLKNVGESPVWLYQYVDQWRIGNAAE